jgi:dTDP-4-dehydrorhamnose 3,5-epimerase
LELPIKVAGQIMPFEIQSRQLGGEVVVIAPPVFADQRGFFMESFRADEFQRLGLPPDFPQDNHSRSRSGVVRGLHFQWEPAMAKLMRVTLGRAFVVAVDLRVGSPTLGQWYGTEISAEDKRQVWAPAGFARGFCALSDWTEVQYKCTAIYNPRTESGIRWNDPEIGIQWPLADVQLSEKDANAQTLREWLASPNAKHFTYRPEI